MKSLSEFICTFINHSKPWKNSCYNKKIRIAFTLQKGDEIRARSHQRLIGWTLGAIVLMLVGSQGLANITGLATGEIEPTGLPWAIVVSLLILYDVAVVALGISGISLLCTLYKK